MIAIEPTTDHAEVPETQEQLSGRPPSPHRLSIVIPMYNEEQSIAPMAARVHEVLKDYAYQWELILVNDGSADNTEHQMKHIQQQYGAHVRVVNLQRNFGQTAAMQAGIDTARGDIIAMLDGDLQNDPIDIPRMVERLINEDLDLVSGWRKDRKDGLWLRKVPSWIANRLIGRITQVHLHDYGCSLKVFRAHVLKSVRLYGEMHRFIPAWLASSTSPARIKEEVVQHHARQFGASKYGISRTFRVILDLLSVYFFMRYRSRPGHFFGMIGFIFGALGTATLGYLFFVKLFFGENIGARPLLMIGVLFIVVAVQFFTTGVLSELTARTYFESSNTHSYIVRNKEAVGNVSDADWKHPV